MRSLTKTMFHPDFNVAKLNTGASLVAQMVKNLPAMQETQEMQVQSMSWEDVLEKKMATHSSIFA